MISFFKTGSLGQHGEKLALKHLRQKGYGLLTKNYKFMRAEIDLVCCDEQNKVLVFAEVKTRTSKNFGEPEDAVSSLKQNQILKAAEGFLSQNEKYENYEKRFDIISVYIDGNRTEITHLEDVF